MSAQTQEIQFRIQELRAKAANGLLTMDETREAIKLMRGSRSTVPTAAGGSKVTKAKAAAKAKPNGDDLLTELEGL